VSCHTVLRANQLMLKARQVLRNYKASDDMWPREWIPRKRDAARAKFAEYLELEVGNL
jgi:acyl-CoA dehydrogenase